jgi:hypothetical protein
LTAGSGTVGAGTVGDAPPGETDAPWPEKAETPPVEADAVAARPIPINML